jgi:hypothetical protein
MNVDCVVACSITNREVCFLYGKTPHGSPVSVIIIILYKQSHFTSRLTDKRGPHLFTCIKNNLLHTYNQPEKIESSG